MVVKKNNKFNWDDCSGVYASENWLCEIELWKCITDLSVEKQGPSLDSSIYANNYNHRLPGAGQPAKKNKMPALAVA